MLVRRGDGGDELALEWRRDLRVVAEEDVLADQVVACRVAVGESRRRHSSGGDDAGEQEEDAAHSLTPMLARGLWAGVAALAFAAVPTPVGTGPRYHPPARSAAAHFACRQAPLAKGSRIHLELFARRRVVIVPAAIGLEGAHGRLGRVVSARCRAEVWTLDPSGIVDYEGRATLGSLFRVWGRRLGRNRLLTFRGPVAVYVGGARRRVDPQAVRLRPGAEIVLEVGGYVPPHRRFLFPPR